MTPPPNKPKRNALALVAVLAVIAGVIVVASSSSHPVSSTRVAAAGTHTRRRTARGPLALAAGYLGLSRAQLHRALRSDGTLAAVANATAGRSEAGLIDALLTSRELALRRASSLGSAAKAKTPSRLARLREQIVAEVNRPQGLEGSAGYLTKAAAYLGVTRRQLRDEQRAGRPLDQIAASTKGRSTSGLIEALVDARKAQLSAEAAAGTITRAQQSALVGRLRQEVTAQVQRKPSEKASAHRDSGKAKSSGSGGEGGGPSEAGGPEGGSSAGAAENSEVAGPAN